MADPYQIATAKAPRGPRISFTSIIAVILTLLVLYQIVQAVSDAPAEIDALQIDRGDRIEYDYIARLPDGRLHSTSLHAVAMEANRTGDYELLPEFTYVPERATINASSPGLRWGSAADAAVEDSYVGGTVHITTDPGAVTGTWTPFTPGGPGIPRELLPQPFSRIVFLQEPDAAALEGRAGNQGFDLDVLNNAIGPLSDGMTYNAGRSFPPSWDLLIEDVNFENRSLQFRHSVQNGQVFDVPELPGTVTVLLRDDGTRLVYRLDLDAGGRFRVQAEDNLHQVGFRPGSYRVATINETHIQLEYNAGSDPDIVGLPLDIEIRIRGKE